MTDPNTTILQRLMSAAPESDVACAAAGLIAERDRLVRECDRLRVALNTERRPQGRYAFLHRHYALGYVRRENQDLHARACADAMQRLSEEGAVTYQDYVRELEEHRALTQTYVEMLRAALQNLYDDWPAGDTESLRAARQSLVDPLTPLQQRINRVQWLEALAARVWDWRHAVIALDGVAAAEHAIVAVLEEEPRP